VIRSYSIGDGCLCWSFAEAIDEITVNRTLFLYRELKSMNLKEKWGIHDIVPSYKSVALHFDPAGPDLDAMEKELDSLIRSSWERMEEEGTNPAPGGKEVVLPVQYEGEDLDRVAAHCGLSRDEVIDLHSGGRYIVAMVGFKPYFPYLLGLDPRLETPRLDTPRTKIPAGAVAIGGAQTGVYPQESPGGWNLIGQTDPELLKQVEPGDTIIMKRRND